MLIMLKVIGVSAWTVSLESTVNVNISYLSKEY